MVKRQAPGWCEKTAREFGSWPWRKVGLEHEIVEMYAGKEIYARNLLVEAAVANKRVAGHA